eukprot:jgi/Ulvmu1/6855/UM031_0060.1
MSISKFLLLLACAALLVASRVHAEDGHDEHNHDDHDHDDHDHDDHDDDHSDLAAASGAGHMDHGGAMNVTEAGDVPVCATDPALATCESYEYPDALALTDAKVNCRMMPFMVACDVVEACEDGSLPATSPHCDAFDLLASTCKDEGMDGMAGCNVYTPMCLNESSVVAQCTLHPGIPGMVNTNPTVEGIASACEGENLPGCANCTSGSTINCPDTLESLNALCQADPTKVVCAERAAMCVATGDNLSIFCEGVSAADAVAAVQDTTSGAGGLRVASAAAAAAAAAVVAGLLV